MSYYQEVTPEERRRKRCFHRVISGLERGGAMSLLTLTESDTAVNPIQKDFRKLYYYLKRRGMLSDYIKVIETTKAGRFHIHLCFRGGFIAKSLISSLWEKYHQSPVVDIRRVKYGYKNKRGVASYLAKYMSKEGARRYSWSWGWVYKGFVKTWKEAYRRFALFQVYSSRPVPFYHFLNQWRAHLRTHSPPDTFLMSLAEANRHLLFQAGVLV